MAMYLICICFAISVSLMPSSFGDMVDLTHTFDETTLHWPGTKPFKLDVIQNGTTKRGVWLQNDELSGSVHAGTHMVAPAHFAKGGITIDEIPISSFIAPAAVVDITTRAESDPDAEVSVDDLLDWESTTNQSLNEAVLLLRTGWGKKWNDRTAYLGTPTDDAEDLRHPGMSPDTARWLVANRNILGLGSDALTFEVGRNYDCPVHQILAERSLFGLGNVANMDQLPIYGATLYMMPMKIGRGSGAPVRIIASLPVVSDVSEDDGKVDVSET